METENTKLSIFSWNVNGIRSAYRKGFLDWLDETKPDILCLQEIRAEQTQLIDKLANPSDYYACWNSAAKPGYAGTALLARKRPISIQSGLGISDFDKEGRVIIAQYPDFVLVNGYFPNGNRSQERLEFKLSFYEAFLAKCQELRNQGHTVILCGDLNTAHKEIDLFNPKSNKRRSGFLPQERQWIDKIIASGYVDTFRHFYPEQSGHYSWWSYLPDSKEKNKGWRFDYIFIAKESIKFVSGAFIMADVSCSDHCPIGIYFGKQ
jgi:exodeoxyribonuclease III